MNRTLAVLVGARISLGLFVVGVVVLSLWTSLGSRSRTPPVLYWSIHIDANSTLDLSKRWKGSSDFDPAKRSGIVMKDEYHVTLLYIGNSTDAEIASHNPKFSSASQVAKLRHELEQRKGEWVRVDVSNFVWEESRIAAAPALLEPRIAALCANVHPHMTLGMAPSVQAVESNKLLARLAAQQNFQQGLPEWLRQLKLSKYTEALSKWCHKHHVTSPEDLSALALAAAIAVEPDLRLRQIVEQILRMSTLHPLHVASTKLQLPLYGTIQANFQA